MKKIEVKVFTDFVCPFCYVGHKMISKIKEDLKDEIEVIITPYFMQIHPEIDGEFWETGRMKTERQHQVINYSLEDLGRPYGIHPKLGEYVANSKKAIILRAFVAKEYPDKLEQYDETVFDTYTVNLKNIGRDDVMQEILEKLEIPVSVAEGLRHTVANIRFELDRAEGMANYVMETPTFVIGSKRVSGAVPEADLKEIIKGQI